MVDAEVYEEGVFEGLVIYSAQYDARKSRACVQIFRDDPADARNLAK